MTRKFLVADLLCGAGGSSTGCERALNALGIEMELVCLNHWPVAIETHKANHPRARHYCQDIATVRPHIIVPEGYLDLLMASPSCTHHSVARGGKPTSDQQRSDPWHILTWFTELRVKRAIIENVWEFTKWSPVDPRCGKPIKSREGEYFRAWVETIWKLGATSIEYRKLNAADYGDATTRSRFIMMIRFDGRPLAWPMPSHRKREEGKLELFPGLKPCRPAREIIDWKIKGRSIFNRKKPLAPKTLARIHAGAVKFNWPEPFLVILRNHMAGQSVDGPLPTIAANGTHIGLAQPIQSIPTFEEWYAKTKDFGGTRQEYDRLYLSSEDYGRRYYPEDYETAQPFIISPRHGKAGAGPQPRGVSQPLPTITAGGSQVAVAEPVIVNGRRNNKAKGVSTDPVPTLDTKGGVWLAEPLILATGEGAARNADQPLPTITTGGAGTEGRPGCARPMLVEPFILNRHGEGYGETRAHSVDEPAPTANCSGGGYLLEPFVLSRQGGGAPRSVEEPTPTQCAKHSQVLISPYYGSGSGETCHTANEPLPTVTSKGRFGMVVPVTNGSGGPSPRHIGEPVPTMTTAKGGEFALVMPVTHHGAIDRALDPNASPLPTVTGANRGELAFIAAQFGEREGQTPRVHAIDTPTPAICATGHINLIEGTEHYDILFRMLEPHELAAAMGFSDEEAQYEFAGTKTEQIKQIGNAVSVRKMQACVAAIAADAAPKKKAKPAERRAAPTSRAANQ